MTKTRTGRLSRLIATLLILIMICSMLPMAAFADGPALTSWAELQSALNAGGTVTLTQSITAGAGDTALTVPVGVTVTLDLNGFTLDRAADSRSDANRSITINGSLTLKDSSADGTGTIKGGRSLDGSDVYVAAGATFTMYGGSIIGRYPAGSEIYNYLLETNSGVHVAAGATFTMYDGKISKHHCTAGNTGGVRLYGGTFVMYGGEISDNRSEENGGGVCMENGSTFTMHGGKIPATREEAL